MIEPAPSNDEIPSVPFITAPPRVYYLSDAQGRMASYYNAMELPESYTISHGIPRTNHFIPVGYCCLEEMAPRLISSRYRGSNPRLPYKSNGHVPAPLHHVEVKVDAQLADIEPKAPSPSTEQQQTVQSAGSPLEEGVKAAHHSVTDSHSSLQAPMPFTTARHSNRQPQIQNPPALPACSSTSCAHHHSPQSGSINQPSVIPAHQNPQHSPISPSPLASPIPAICRRWLSGTCRRGSQCRNRHHVFDETDAELMRIRDAHLATIRFYNLARGEDAKTDEKPRDGDLRPSSGSAVVEDFVEGVRRVKIPAEVLSGQLTGLKLEEKVVVLDASRELTASSTLPLVSVSPAVSATESHTEPLPDYTLSMPPTGPTTLSAPSAPRPVAHAHIQRVASTRAQPPIHPVKRFRATYAPQHLSRLVHPSPQPRRHPQQDFVPRHVLDRALQQYIAGSLRGRRFLGPRPPGARKRAVVAQMGSVEVEGKGGSTAVTTALTVGGKKTGEMRAEGEEQPRDVGKEVQVEIAAEKPAVVSGLLVDVGPL